MPDAIGALSRTGGLGPVRAPEPRAPERPSGGPGFRSLVSGLVDQVNSVQQHAGETVAQFASGDGDDLHEVLLAVSKAELSFKFLMEARNKLVDAYHEVMRMQL